MVEGNWSDALRTFSEVFEMTAASREGRFQGMYNVSFPVLSLQPSFISTNPGRSMEIVGVVAGLEPGEVIKEVSVGDSEHISRGDISIRDGRWFTFEMSGRELDETTRVPVPITVVTSGRVDRIVQGELRLILNPA
jgi:hypothetical protein